MFTDELEFKQGKGVPVNRPIDDAVRASITRLVNRTPEVMVKVSTAVQKDKDGNVISYPSPRDMKALSGLVDYIGKDGNDLIDETGCVFHGKDKTSEALRGWGNIPASNGTKREALHFVLSMPAGTDQRSVQRAVEDFAKAHLSEHQYLIGHHTDTDRPHSHIALKMETIHGLRINPDPKQLQAWREGFAKALIARGVPANATSRLDRLTGRQKVQQSRYQHHKRQSTEKHSHLSGKAQEAAVQSDMDALVNPELVRRPDHDRTLAAYAGIYQQLKAGSNDDRKLGERLRDFVEHQTRVTAPERTQSQDLGPELG